MSTSTKVAVELTTAATPPVIAGADGRYRLLSRLGQGGSGRTHLVEDEQGRLRVLKLLDLAGVDRWKVVELFERETAALAGLDHPGIPRLLDRVNDPEQGLLGLVLERVEGRPLGELIRDGTPLELPRFVALLDRCLEVLAYLHAQVPPLVHRDVTPGNILVAEEQAWLIDFGTVKSSLRESTQVTAAGTFGYMAPEQTYGRACPASDLYGLGMTFIALATRRRAEELPLDGRTGRPAPGPLLDHLPPALAELLLALIRPGLAERPGDAAQVRAQLAQIRAARTGAGTDVAAVRPVDRRARARPTSAGRTGRGRRWLRWLAGVPAVSLLLTLGGGYGLSRWPAERQIRSLGGWFSGHGDLGSSIQATLLGDVYGWPPAAVEALAFSPDDRVLATLAHDEVLLWETATGRLLGRHRERLFPGTLLWRADGRELYVMGDFGTVVLLDGQTARLLRRFEGVSLVRRHFPDHGLEFLGGTLDEQAQLWLAYHLYLEQQPYQVAVLDAASGELVRVVEPGWVDRAATAFADQGRWLLATGNSRGDRIAAELLVIDLAPPPAAASRLDQPATAPRIPLGNTMPRELLPLPGRGQVVLITSDGAELWDWQQGTRLVQLPLPQPYYGSHAALDRTGQRLAVPTHHGAMVYDLADGHLRLELTGHPTYVESVAFSHDGQLLATGSRDQTARLWRVE